LPIINPQSISPNQGSGYLPGGAGPPAERSNHESLNHRSGVCTGRGRCLCPTTTDIWHSGPRLHRSNAGPVADVRNPEPRRRIHVSNAGAATDVCDPEHQWRVHPAATRPAADVHAPAINHCAAAGAIPKPQRAPP